MKNYKSVEEVLKRGYWTVNFPIPFIMIGFGCVALYVTPLLVSKQYEGILAFLGLILGFCLGWLWWSYKIVKWRIWAFENTNKEDWITLKYEAIEQQLIWEDGNIFEKTEIRSRVEQAKIEAINREIDRLIEEEEIIEYWRKGDLYRL